MTSQMSNKELNALIHLLDEPDERAFDKIREKIISFGNEAIPVLEDSWNETLAGLVHERIDEIILNIRQDQVKFDFSNWLHTGSSDLLKGFILVSKVHYPELNEDEIIQFVEKMRMDAWLEMNDSLTALENVKVLNHIIYQVHRFDGNKNDLQAPENFYVNTVIQSRKGSPLSLGMIYSIVARKLMLPVYGVNLPQHFILAYALEMTSELPSGEDILFYINPFNQGAVFTRKEIELFVRQLNIPASSSFFTPCSNTEIIRRLLETLIFCYTQIGLPEKNKPLEDLLTLIRKS
jgi:regulator of sirC expression with transglutaminase-like and TPR domain